MPKYSDFCPSRKLTNAAQKYAQVLGTQNHFDHVGPDGKHPGDRIEEEGFKWNYYSENIIGGYEGIESAMAAWMNSPGMFLFCPLNVDGKLNKNGIELQDIAETFSVKTRNL
jgi:hypothetical protein